MCQAVAKSQMSICGPAAQNGASNPTKLVQRFFGIADQKCGEMTTTCVSDCKAYAQKNCDATMIAAGITTGKGSAGEMACNLLIQEKLSSDAAPASG